MQSQQNDDREQLVRTIESQKEINGRYTQIKRLGNNAGSGHFSLVFCALDSESNDRVCLKVYNVFRMDDYRLGCFTRESRILDQLRGQPDILPIVETENTFTLEGQLPFPLRYISTALARTDAGEYIYHRQRKQSRDLDLFGAMCRGVQRIHAGRICHRDLKPANFFIGPRDLVWLGDFGTARKLDGSEPPLRQDYGQLLFRGDLGYTAPELLCGLEQEQLFFLGDFFSLGAILFEMFTLTPLYSYVYDRTFISDLTESFGLMPTERRPGMFHELLPTIAARRPLPSLRQVPNQVPPAIMPRIDRLYQGLANLDYRRRLRDFRHVFHEINICRIILQRRTQYEAWLRQRQARRNGRGQQDK